MSVIRIKTYLYRGVLELIVASIGFVFLLVFIGCSTISFKK